MVEPRIVYGEVLYNRGSLHGCIKVFAVAPVETYLLLLLLLPLRLQWRDANTRTKRFSTWNIRRRCQWLTFALRHVEL